MKNEFLEDRLDPAEQTITVSIKRIREVEKELQEEMNCGEYHTILLVFGVLIGWLSYVIIFG